jgi:hypothetical protein
VGEGGFAEAAHVGVAHDFASSESRLFFEANQGEWLVGFVKTFETDGDFGLAFEFVDGAAPEARLAGTGKSDGCRKHCGCVLM